MPELGAYTEDVVFNWEAADSLVAELRSTANVLERQIGERRQIAAGARTQWEGSYGEQFDGRTNICTGDAQRFVTKMREAANGLQELADLAREEQDRREQAREWVAQQEDKNLVEEGLDALQSVFGFGEDVPPPPPPRDPPNIPIHDPSSAPRGPSTPALS